MLYRIIAVLIVVMGLAACDSGSDEPLPTVATIPDSGDTSTDDTTTDDSSTTEEETTTDDSSNEVDVNDAGAVSDDAESSEPVRFHSTLNDAPEFVGEGVLVVTYNDTTYTASVQLAEGWSTDGNTMTNGTITVQVDVHPTEGESLIGVVQSQYDGSEENIIADGAMFDREMVFSAYVYEQDTNTLYMAFNTSGGELFNPIIVTVQGSADDIEAAFPAIALGLDGLGFTQ